MLSIKYVCTHTFTYRLFTLKHLYNFFCQISPNCLNISPFVKSRKKFHKFFQKIAILATTISCFVKIYKIAASQQWWALAIFVFWGL